MIVALDLSSLPLFGDLSQTELDDVVRHAETFTAAPGEVLFYEGDPPDVLYVLTKGRCTITYAGESRGDILAPGLLDPPATLGGLPHQLKTTAAEDSEFLRWPVEQLWQSSWLSAAARRYLAIQLRQIRIRLDEIAAPIHYIPGTAWLLPGPFLFEETTMVIAFCEADTDAVKACLPPGLSLLQRPLRKTSPVFIALAKFPNAHPQHKPSARFSYTETTYFIPVRRRVGWGFFVPHIYPSSWEPILLGREIYGFPKRLGETIFEPNAVSLKVDEEDFLHLEWQGAQGVGEARLVGALSEWLGFEWRLTAAAFQAGDVLRKAAHLPPYRRIDVYNHRRILAPDADHENPIYSVDQLTHAAFGILRWHQIARIRQPELTVAGGPFALANLTLCEAYRTQLDMRLSVGRVEEDYLKR